MSKSSEMRLGYGSEFQLLRFMGHHRLELEDAIRKQTGIEGSLTWFDFPKDQSEKPRSSLDKEYMGIEFLKDMANYEIIEQKWKEYWPHKSQYWDGIILNVHQTSWQYILVEAKAHLEELESDSQAAKEQSIAKINKAFNATKKRFDISTPNDWSKCYYQAANRLAFINFMLENGINASLLNIYFINGWKKRNLLEETRPIVEDKSVRTESEWKEKINEEYIYLGFNNTAKKYIREVFLEC
jgi:hypothetical protein